MRGTAGHRCGQARRQSVLRLLPFPLQLSRTGCADCFGPDLLPLLVTGQLCTPMETRRTNWNANCAQVNLVLLAKAQLFWVLLFYLLKKYNDAAHSVHNTHNVELRVHPHAREYRPWLHARVRGELSSAISSYTHGDHKLVLVHVLNSKKNMQVLNIDARLI